MHTRHAFTMLAAAALLLAPEALADVGPPPSCPDGCHSAYWRGRRCVPDGYHIEEVDGGPVVVADADAAQPDAGHAPATRKLGHFCEVIEPAPTGTAASSSSSTPKTRGRGCHVAPLDDAHGGAASSAIVASLAMLLGLRRRARA